MYIDIVDSSGFRVYYTDRAQEENAGLLFIGQNVVGHMIIPPGVERYTVNAFCSNRCTNAVSIKIYTYIKTMATVDCSYVYSL